MTYTQTFKTTEKGLRSLETYIQMDSMIKAANNNNDTKKVVNGPR